MFSVKHGSTLIAMVVMATISASVTVAAAAAVGGEPSPAMLDYAADLASDYDVNGLSGFASGGFGGAEPADLSFADGMGPPDPSKFRTPEELKNYLERLQLYYALVGRPRFGKRSGSAGYRRRSRSSWGRRQQAAQSGSGDGIIGYAVFF
ncbi:hypothetical protein BOX15_Mlig009644g3 [Macrostomum lignano]|uniref:Uncharacterized protein n=1 Tax=Macrostomum lignano TaxID=282301 RepID=A0A267FKR9_9PLAT|nr:hypothetical protein BOX15_Mlig009644g2 [Macrostomum lignano]PAA73737.1 hypothetical protein BOX15_Mlig009644g3 [Macrostomum lignano]